jgi:hypothetical protein
MRSLIILILLASTALLCVDQADAVTFFDESFENGTLTSQGWTTGSCQYMGFTAPPADGCNPTRSTDLAHSGTHSLKKDYTMPLIPDGGLGTHGEWIDRAHQATDEVFYRVWVYSVNFTYDPARTKAWYTGTQYPNFVITNAWGQRNMSIDSQTEVGGVSPCNSTYTSCWYPANVVTVSQNDGQWYCIEAHAKMNTLGQANGVLELWVNGIQTLGYYNRTFRDGSTTNGMVATSNFNTVRIFTQGGSGIEYYDDFAVGDTRIGCNVSQPNNGPPPAAPVGLAVR